jgi:hypothetical protein
VAHATYPVSHAVPCTVSGAAVSGGCTAATACASCTPSGTRAPAASRTATSTSAAAPASASAASPATSDQRAGRCDHQCRYEGYRNELGYFRHDDLLFVLNPRPRPRNATRSDHVPLFAQNWGTQRGSTEKEGERQAIRSMARQS